MKEEKLFDLKEEDFLTFEESSNIQMSIKRQFKLTDFVESKTLKALDKMIVNELEKNKNKLK